MRRLVKLIALVLVSLSLSLGTVYTADAGSGKKGGKGDKGGGQAALISRDKAASIARSATGGRVLNIQLKRGKRPKYSVKVLVGGKRVRKVGVDARSGAVLK